VLNKGSIDMNMKHLIVHLFLVSAATADLTLWYTSSATKFEEALPIGCGRLGGMVYGTVSKDRISLNESTVWNGNPGNNNRNGAANNLATARQKIFSNDATGACAAINNMIGGGEASYQPVGNLFLDFSGQTATNYRRELDLKTAIAKTTYTSGGVTYTREYFASYPDQAVIVRLTANQPGKITFTASLESPHTNKTISASGTTITLNGTVNAIKFQTRAKIATDGGTIAVSGSILKVSGANSATILVVIGTNFNSYNNVTADQAARAEKYLTSATAKTYDEIRAGHISSYKELFDRVDIQPGTPTNDSTLTTGQQVKKFATSNDPQLVRLHYQFGRYLLISSSRGESQPANLQGVWNESTSPSWGSKYTININTEMNYWPATTANLLECAVPLYNKIKAMVTPGKETAKVHWGSDKGWVAHHNTDLWNRTAPIDGAWGLWPTGAAWLCTHLWEHYLFTQDKSFLAEYYPVMKESAEFFLATMVEEPFSGKKYLGTCPSASPENKPGAWNCDGSFAPTMDVQIIRDILNYSIEASKILDTDAEFRSQADATVKRLPPNQIGKSGQLMEWFKDWDSPTDKHRHVSHCYGLFPSAQISVRGTPDLAKAATTTLTQRGDMATGWSLAWKINFWARLEDGNHAYKLIQMLLTPERTDPNLFDEHPPFQIDGNFGAVSGINEMLLQSHNDEINFLPALPDRWSSGSFRGLRARGGFIIDSVSWTNKTLVKAIVSSLAGNTCNVRHKSIVKTFPTEAGMTYVLDASLNVIDSYKSGQTSVIGSNESPEKKQLHYTLVKPSVAVTTVSRGISVKITGKTSDVTVQVFDLSGRVVASIDKLVDSNSRIVFPDMHSGSYIVKVYGTGVSHTQKVTLQ